MSLSLGGKRSRYVAAPRDSARPSAAARPSFQRKGHSRDALFSAVTEKFSAMTILTGSVYHEGRAPRRRDAAKRFWRVSDGRGCRPQLRDHLRPTSASKPSRTLTPRRPGSAKTSRVGAAERAAAPIHSAFSQLVDAPGRKKKRKKRESQMVWSVAL